MKKVKRLKRGSNIAIISPSSGLPDLFPDIFKLGIKNLTEVLGFKLIEYPTARMSREELYRNPKLRADDINHAFEDENIDGIICSIGGYDSVRILEYLDTSSIMNHPKFIMGFSDATTFLAYLNTLGLVTFYGPSVMAGFAQLKHLPSEFTRHVEDMLMNPIIPYHYAPYDRYTEGYKDWSDLSTLGECTEFKPNTEGYQFLLGKDPCEGLLWGGCIEVLEFIKGTDYWPEMSFWDDRILFLETSEDKPSPMNVGYMLRNYGTQGILGKIKGLIIARPKDYSEEEKYDLIKIITDILTVEFNVENLPVVLNVDFGHTDPKVILPLGCRIRMIPRMKEIILLESPFLNE